MKWNNLQALFASEARPQWIVSGAPTLNKYLTKSTRILSSILTYFSTDCTPPKSLLALHSNLDPVYGLLQFDQVVDVSQWHFSETLATRFANDRNETRCKVDCEGGRLLLELLLAVAGNRFSRGGFVLGGVHIPAVRVGATSRNLSTKGLRAAGAKLCATFGKAGVRVHMLRDVAQECHQARPCRELAHAAVTGFAPRMPWAPHVVDGGLFATLLSGQFFGFCCTNKERRSRMRSTSRSSRTGPSIRTPSTRFRPHAALHHRGGAARAVHAGGAAEPARGLAGGGRPPQRRPCVAVAAALTLGLGRQRAALPRQRPGAAGRPAGAPHPSQAGRAIAAAAPGQAPTSGQVCARPGARRQCRAAATIAAARAGGPSLGGSGGSPQKFKWEAESSIDSVPLHSLRHPPFERKAHSPERFRTLSNKSLDAAAEAESPGFVHELLPREGTPLRLGLMKATLAAISAPPSPAAPAAPAALGDRPWRLLPSVGTWYAPLRPAGRQGGAEAAQPGKALACAAAAPAAAAGLAARGADQWFQRPSVGTWLLHRKAAAVAIADDSAGFKPAAPAEKLTGPRGGSLREAILKAPPSKRMT
ncbi:unnamed protein product [Prorocentrum cordatum]|uniref:Uncharacterized protein n=1 Tax=Prorocentrum cordatum TaxID=2364126 RepID=A0ABN9U2Z6_9DINO|nr:unnamed protein product [Polarella glacialis]